MSMDMVLYSRMYENNIFFRHLFGRLAAHGALRLCRKLAFIYKWLGLGMCFRFMLGPGNQHKDGQTVRCCGTGVDVVGVIMWMSECLEEQTVNP